MDAVVAGEGTITEVETPAAPVATEAADLSALGSEKVTAVAEAMSADPSAIKDVAPEIVAGMAEIIEPAAMADLPSEMMGSMVEVMSGDQVSDLGAEQKEAALESAGAGLIEPSVEGGPAPTEFAEMPAVETAITATDAAPTAELVAMIDSVGAVFEFMAAGTGEGLAPEMPEMPEVIAPIDTGAAPAGDAAAPTTAVGGDAAADAAAQAEAVAEAEAAAEAADQAQAAADQAQTQAEELQAAAEANPNDAAAQEAALAAADAADAAGAAAEAAASEAEAEAAGAAGAEAEQATGQ
jgi:SWI/SNF-related matrix-associated actin-dependent regulator 1 of chromatin subfamily A